MKNKVLVILSMLLMVWAMPCFGLDWSYWTTKNWDNEWFVTQTAWTTALWAGECGWANKQIKYYLDWDMDWDWNPDMWHVRYYRDNGIYEGGSSTYRVALQTINANWWQGTSVRYYVPEDKMFRVYSNGKSYSLSDTPVWYRASSIFPIWEWVRAVNSEPVLISAPANKENNKMQVAYKIRYSVFRWYESTSWKSYLAMKVSWRSDMSASQTSSFWWIKWNPSNDNWLWPTWSKDYVNQESSVSTKWIQWSSTEYEHDYECFNMELAWCWDGKVQNGWSYDNGVTPNEQCDWWSNCTADCKLIPDASCNSELDWKTKYDNDTTKSWVERSWKLYCSVWTSSWYKWEKSTWKITWTCTNWTSTKSCEAKQTFCWNGSVEENNESCDWWDNCNSSCGWKDASCNSELDWKTKYDNDTTKSWVERSWKLYCSVWTSSWYKWEKSTWKITWTCTNWTSTKSCEAKQTFCWNGSVEEDNCFVNFVS